MGPKWLRRGPEKGQGRKRSEKGSQKGDPAVKNYPLWESKIGKNLSKNVFENMMVFKSLSGSILGSFCIQNGTPKCNNWDQNRSENCIKLKNEFSLPYSKTNGFLIKTWVRGLHFRSSNCKKMLKKLSLISISFFRSLFHILWPFWGPFWGAKRDLRGDF